MVDTSVDFDENDRDIIQFLKNRNVIVLLNKSDLSGVITEEKLLNIFEEILPGENKPVMIKTSAKAGEGLSEFEKIVKKAIDQGLLVISAGGNVLRLVPPLVIEKEHIDEMIEKLKKAIE